MATNAGGVARGVDQTLTTAAPTPTNPPAPAPPPDFAGVKLVSTRLTFAGRFITLTLRCPSGTVGRCSGQTKLTVRRRRPGSRAASPITLGRARFSISAGEQATVRVRVSRAGRRQLKRAGRLRARATTAALNGAGQSKTALAAVTIRRRHR